ncbi:MAG: trimeric intracellular cation channel family protein [Actinobacteria bacterium]|nr:trimeric intracellular cation channel family protein [Actinomycetota bacterium]
MFEQLCINLFTVAPALAADFGDVAEVLTTTEPVTAAALSIPIVLEYVAVVAGALSGGIFACEKKFDLFGVITLAISAGLGGGIIRDILLEGQQIYALYEPSLIIISAIAGVLVFYFKGLFKHLSATMFLFDALSVGLFAFVGAEKAIQAGLGPVSAVIIGTITAVGGGALRDVLAREVPPLFKQGNFYGVAGFIGALIYILLTYGHISKTVAAIACVVITLGLRYASVYFDWRTSEPKDLTPRLSQSIRQFFPQLFLRSGGAEEIEGVPEEAKGARDEAEKNLEP